MKKKFSRVIGMLLVVIAIAFLWYSLNHPEASFPWSNTITYIIYGLYGIIATALLIAPWNKKQ